MSAHCENACANFAPRTCHWKVYLRSNNENLALCLDSQRPKGTPIVLRLLWVVKSVPKLVSNLQFRAEEVRKAVVDYRSPFGSAFALVMARNPSFVTNRNEKCRTQWNLRGSGTHDQSRPWRPSFFRGRPPTHENAEKSPSLPLSATYQPVCTTINTPKTRRNNRQQSFEMDSSSSQNTPFVPLLSPLNGRTKDHTPQRLRH